MAKLRAVGGTGLMLAGFALLLTRCAEAPGRDRGDDDDAGTPQAGSMNQAGIGGSAGQTAASGGTAPSAGASGAGGSGTAGANTGGSVAGAGGSTAGTLNTAGTLAQGGTSADACENAPQVISPDAFPQPVEQAAFEAAFPALVCATAAACCARGTIPYDAAACLSYAATTALDRTKGFDRFEAGRCLESLAQYDLTCRADLSDAGLPNGCYLAYRGPLALGETCERQDDCLPDPRGRVGCEFIEELGESVCVVNVRGKLGDTCHTSCESAKESGICILGFDSEDPLVEVICHGEDGLYCHGFDGVCKANKGAGCECLPNAGDCNSQHQCDDTLDNDVCMPRHAAGEACVTDRDCILGNRCVDNDVCAPRKHQGEPCDAHAECLGYCELAGCGLDNSDPRGLFRDAFCDGIGSDT